MANKGKAIAKGAGWLAKKIGRGGSKAKGFVTKGAPSLRQANKEKEAALSAFKEAAKKESAAVRASGTEAGLRLSHRPEMDAAKKAYKAASQKADAAKQVMKRRATRLGIGAAAVGTYAKSNAEKSALNKRIKDLETVQSKPQSAPKQETPAPTPASVPEQKTPETSNNGGNSSSSGGSRSGGARVRVRENSGSGSVRTSSSSTHNGSGVRVRPSRRKEDVFNKETGKTDRYKIKQENKTKRTEIRAERSKERQKQRTARQNNRQANKSERQAKRQDRKANRRNR